MGDVLLNLLVMSIAGSVVTALMLLLRPLTGNIFPAKWQYRIGKMALAFFLMPSLLMLKKVIFHEQIIHYPMVLDNVTNIELAYILMINNINVTIIKIIFIIWLVGVMIFTLWQLYCYNKFIKNIQANSISVTENSEAAILLSLYKEELDINKEVNLMQSNEISSPMLVGLYRPTILLPNLNNQKNDLRFILVHELTHLKQKDLWVKMFALITRALHWFNPLVHLLSKDINVWGELSCDESLVSKMSLKERKLYGETIINTLKIHSGINSNLYSSLCKNKKHIKRRLTKLLNFKESKRQVVFFAVASILAIGGIGVIISAFFAKNASELQNYDNYIDSNKTVIIENAELFRSENVVVGDINNRDPKYTPRQRIE